MDMYPTLYAASNVLIHVPDLVRYGSKPYRELTIGSDSFGKNFKRGLRSYSDAVAYPVNQAFIGNIRPETLGDIPSPWYEHQVSSARTGSAFGEILPQEPFYELFREADQFDLLMFDKDWELNHEPDSEVVRSLFQANGARKKYGKNEISRAIETGEALPLYQQDRLIGCINRAHDEDESLGARILLENLVGKASGAYALRHLLHKSQFPLEELDYVIGCSEEAIGDRYNRGGGNMGKAIAEMVGCKNAAGFDVKAFCAAPVYALIHGASLIKAGVAQNVAVVGGGSLSKLGMKAHRHIEKNIPILEDVLGGVAFLLGAGSGNGPRANLDIVGKHSVGCPSTPQGIVEALVRDPLRRAGRKLCDIDKYAVELHNPEITVPAGSGNVPLVNYKMLAALAVMEGEIGREDIPRFVEERGMPGFAPTQGHVPAAVPYLGHALEEMTTGDMQSVMVMAKGSPFLGRMTQQSDGASIVFEM